MREHEEVAWDTLRRIGMDGVTLCLHVPCEVGVPPMTLAQAASLPGWPRNTDHGPYIAVSLGPWSGDRMVHLCATAGETALRVIMVATGMLADRAAEDIRRRYADARLALRYLDNCRLYGDTFDSAFASRDCDQCIRDLCAQVQV